MTYTTHLSASKRHPAVVHRAIEPFTQRRVRPRLGPCTTYAIATNRDVGSIQPRVPDGHFGMPIFGESMEWLKDMPTFFRTR